MTNIITAPDTQAPTSTNVLARWARALRNPMGIAAATMLSIVILLAIFAPIIWGEQADTINTDVISQGPSLEHLLGTDALGRDLLARVLVATRLSLMLALVASVLGVSLGIVCGTIPWLLGRRLGGWATAVINISVAFPSLLLALYFAVIFGVGIGGAVGAVGLATVPTFARLTQTLIAGIQERDFIAAARVSGIKKPVILARHILPNIGEPLAISATISSGNALLAFAGLSFLGLGVQAPEYDWGVLLNQGLSSIYIYPSNALAPGLAIVIAGLALNLLGEVIAKNVGLNSALSAASPISAVSRAVQKRNDKLSAARAEKQSTPDSPVLEVENLTVTVPSPAGRVDAVRGITFSIAPGEAIGVVGESGSGKSLTALAIARLLENPVNSDADTLRLLGHDLLAQDDGSRAKLLGLNFGFVFQDPTSSFNPTIRIGKQLSEGVKKHEGLDRAEAKSRVVERLSEVRIPSPEQRAHQYPHEFSGGMRQRAMIAMAMMGEPAIIVADEPTTALDVTVQKQILELLQSIRNNKNVSILLISHDLAVVAQLCERVLVMYAGRIVEDLPSSELRTGARHPYTRALLAAMPDKNANRDQPLTVIPGRAPDPSSLPTGCPFAPRCAFAIDRCHEEEPPLVSDGNGKRVACWRADETDLLPIVSVTTKPKS